MFCDAREHLAQICLRVASVEFRAPDQAVDHRGTFSARIAAGEEVVLTPQGYASQRAFGGVVVDLDTAVVAIAAQRYPARERVTYRFCRLGLLRKTLEGFIHPFFHRIEQRTSSFLPHGATLSGRESAYVALDHIKRRDAFQRLVCNRPRL